MSVVQGDDVTLADLVALNYTILIPYNASIPTGGDSLHDNLNLYYTVSFSTHPNAHGTGLILCITVWRSRLVNDFDCVGAAHDTRCWVNLPCSFSARDGLPCPKISCRSRMNIGS